MEPGVIREFRVERQCHAGPIPDPHHLILEPCDGLGRALVAESRCTNEHAVEVGLTADDRAKPRLERGALTPTIALDRRVEHVTAEQDRPRTGPEDASIWVLHAPCRHRPDDVGSRRPHRGGFASR